MKRTILCTLLLGGLSTFNFQLSTIPWHWDKVAKENPFFAQLWAPLHDAKEDNIYGPEIFEGWE